MYIILHNVWYKEQGPLIATPTLDLSLKYIPQSCGINYWWPPHFISVLGAWKNGIYDRLH